MTSLPDNTNRIITKTWRPVVGGILSIFLGIIDMLSGFTIAVLFVTVTRLFGGHPGAGIAGIPVLVLGIVAVIGGFFSITRRSWGVALAGAICGLLFPFFALALQIAESSPGILAVDIILVASGITSLVLITNSKSEFK